MTAHLTWPQPQYERIPCGIVAPRVGRRGTSVVCLVDWIQKGGGPAGAVEEN